MSEIGTKIPEATTDINTESHVEQKPVEDSENASVSVEENPENNMEVECEDGEYEEEDLEKEAAESTENTDVVCTDDQKSGEDKPEGMLGFKYKRVLKNSTRGPSIEPLPEGWVMATHTCGIPIYLHKKTRVVTWSRPYSLLSGYIMKHKVPLQSIPCLHYERNKEESSDKESTTTNQETNENNSDCNHANNNDTEGETAGLISKNETPANETLTANSASGVQPPKVILHDQKNLCLDDEELKAYLERRFEFKTLQIPQFKKWSQRRDFNRNMKRKRLEETNVETNNASNGDDLNKGGAAKLITLTVRQEDGPGGSTRNREFVLNTTRKPMLSILHEYAQRVLRVQPNYTFTTREDSAEPFEATIKLDGKVYGTAVAINKKMAKNKAALATLEMLIPGFKGRVESTTEAPDMAYFNEISVTDSRVHELCVHYGQLLPYQLLAECLKRNQGVADTNVSYDVQQGKRRTLNYTMKCGKHVVNGVAKNKKIGKQVAAQQILQLLHPKVKTWAELIEMYGMSLAQERARRKQEEQEIFDLKQRRGNVEEERTTSMSGKQQANGDDQNSLEPNPELLAKLRAMMKKLQSEREKRKAEVQSNITAKKQRITPMAAAVAAGKGLLDLDTKPEGETADDSSNLDQEK